MNWLSRLIARTAAERRRRVKEARLNYLVALHEEWSATAEAWRRVAELNEKNKQDAAYARRRYDDATRRAARVFDEMKATAFLP